MKLTPLGVYKYFTDNTLADFLSPQDPDHVREELASLYLVELLAEDVRVPLKLYEFFQTEEWVAYSEEFLDYESSQPVEPPTPPEAFYLIQDEQGRTWKHLTKSKRVELASEEDLRWKPEHPVDGTRFRLIFFIHCYDPEKPLQTPAGPVTLPSTAPLPERLRWKDYIYWD